MSYYYQSKVTYSSQEDDNFGMSEDSYMDSDPMKAGGSVDKESLEYKKRRQKNNEGNGFVLTKFCLSTRSELSVNSVH